MAIKPLKPAADQAKPDPMAFIEGKSPAPAPAEPEDTGKKDKRFMLYFDAPLLARLDREAKRRGGMSRSALLRQLAAEHLPE